MPFLKLTTTVPDTPDSPEPLFVFPGIFLKGDDVNSLVEELKNRYPNRQIYLWSHPKYDSDDAPDINNLGVMLDDIKKEIFSLQPKKSPTEKYHLTGVSWGGALAEMLSHSLKEDKVYVKTNIIDSPSLAALQNHFVEKNPAATRDLIAIMNESALMSKIPERVFSEEEIADICESPLSSPAGQLDDTKNQISKISAKFTNLSLPLSSLTTFATIFKVVSEQIRLLHTYEFEPKTKIDSLLIMSTRETREKFNLGRDLGRMETADKITLFDLNSHGREMHHRDCLNEHNAPILVSHIVEHFPQPVFADSKSVLDQGNQRKLSPSKTRPMVATDDDMSNVFRIPPGLLKSSSPDLCYSSPESSPMASSSSPSSSSDDEDVVASRKHTARKSPLAGAARRSLASSPRFFMRSPSPAEKRHVVMSSPQTKRGTHSQRRSG